MGLGLGLNRVQLGTQLNPPAEESGYCSLDNNEDYYVSLENDEIYETLENK